MVISSSLSGELQIAYYPGEVSTNYYRTAIFTRIGATVLLSISIGEVPVAVVTAEPRRLHWHSHPEPIGTHLYSYK